MSLLGELMSCNQFIHRQYLDYMVDVILLDLGESYALFVLHMALLDRSRQLAMVAPSGGRLHLGAGRHDLQADRRTWFAATLGIPHRNGSEVKTQAKSASSRLAPTGQVTSESRWP